MNEKRTWSIEFYGPSWALGVICTAVYLGALSWPWLLMAPLLLLQAPLLTVRFGTKA